MADKFTIFVRDDKRCQGQPAMTRLVLYALAARSDENGYCWPSIEQLMTDTGLSRASIFRAMTNIREILTVDAPGYKHSNSYIFPHQSLGKRRISGSIVANGGENLRNVDNQSHSETAVSHRDKSLTLRPTQSHSETGGGLTVRPEEYIRRIQEESLSLTLSQKPDSAIIVDKCVDKSIGYDGSRKPKSRADIEKIRQWCKMALLDDYHTNDFIRINRLAKWSAVSEISTVPDLIADFVLKWQQKDPEGFFYYRDRLAQATRRAEEEELRKRVESESAG